MKLTEKYRPTDWPGLIGQQKAVAAVRRLIERPDFDGDHFWIAGPSGTGKTSMARMIARKLADPFEIIELDGEACTVDAVRQVCEAAAYYPMQGDYKVWIVNEAQAMTPRAVQAWLTALESLPPKRCVVFTTTADGADLFGEYAAPFFSRCKAVNFTSQGLCKAFAERARTIAAAENLDGQDVAWYERLAKDCHNNLREMLQKIEFNA